MRNAVVIVGNGMMGSGIAAVSSLNGHKTILVGRKLDNAKAAIPKIRANIKELLDNGLVDELAANTAYELLFATDDLEGACAEAFIVIEAIAENLPAKQELFAKLDGILPIEVPILSNTSGLRITEIAALTQNPQRTATTHFWFPAHLVPLVEVVMGEKTNEEMAVSVKKLLAGWGKAPVLVRRDLPGQLANRILQAVIREAVNIVEIGLAEPEDVDTAIKMGMGIRLPVWGPLEHIDAVGLDLGLSVQRTVLPEISNSQTPSPYLEKIIAQGNLGYKTGKGFYDWSVKDMAVLAKLRNDFIIHALKMMKKQQTEKPGQGA